IEATFETVENTNSHYLEHIESRSDDISLRWYDFLPAFAGGGPAPSEEKRVTLGHYAVYIYSRRATGTLNRVGAQGEPKRAERGPWQITGCGLCLAETWLRPREGYGSQA